MLIVADYIKALTVADTEGTGGYIRDRVEDDEAVVLAHVVRVLALVRYKDSSLTRNHTREHGRRLLR